MLVLIFGISMWRDISMGVVAFPVAFINGTLYFGVSTAEITKGFPGALVTTLIGVTYLFGAARTNGTIQQIVRSLLKLVHGKVLLLAWVFFMLAAAITASGALSLATYSILIPLGLSFARSHKVSPLVMGLSILNGTNAGGAADAGQYRAVPLRPGHEVADDLGLQHDHHRAGDHLAGLPGGLSQCRLVPRHHARAAGPCGQDSVPSSSRMRWTSWAICSTSASMPVKVICPRRRATKSTAISVP